MFQQQINAQKLVSRFGGPTTLQRRLAKAGYTISVKGINMWVTRRSIPAEWLMVLSSFAETDGKPLHLHTYSLTNTKVLETASEEAATFLD